MLQNCANKNTIDAIVLLLCTPRLDARWMLRQKSLKKCAVASGCTLVDHAQRIHARFGASSAHRWFACPGSVRLCAGLPDVPSAAALEGTRAHELLEMRLRMVLDFENVMFCLEAEAQWRTADAEMRDAVRVCYDHVVEILEDHPDAVLLVEHRFEIPVASAPGEVFGTNDVCVFVPSMRTLHVIDYKHGAGVYVPVEGNKQLRFYALGALASYDDATSYLGRFSGIDSVCLTIVQPRCAIGEPVRSEWLAVETVLEFGKEIGEAVARCKAPDAPLVPGKEQCGFCPAAASCPAREALALEAVGRDFGDVVHVTQERLPRPVGMTSDRLAAVLAVAPQVRAWLDDLEDEARRRLEAGEAVPGLKLVEAQARRQWVRDDADAAARELADIAPGALDPQQFKVEKLRGLGEVEAVLKRNVDRVEARRRLDAMAFLTTKKSSGALTVAPENDPRPAVNRARQDFAGVVQLENKQ